MLQIENEIEKEILKKDKCDKDKLLKLQKEFNEWKKKAVSKWKRYSSSDEYAYIPQRIKNLIFRNYCRDLMNLNDINLQIESIKKIKSRISTNYYFNKPSDPSSGIYSKKNAKRNYKCYIDENDLNRKLKILMNKEIGYRTTSSLSSYYNVEALPFLLEKSDKFTTSQKSNIVNNYYNKLLILSSGNKENENKIIRMIVSEMGSTSYPSFNNRSIHRQINPQENSCEIEFGHSLS